MEAPLTASPAFVGRAGELAALGRALAHPPALVLVEGDAGIGKSRLLREFLDSPEGRGRRTVVARCPPLREPFTLGPLVDALRQATDRVEGLGLSGLAGTLRPLFPEWAAQLPPAPAPAGGARAARHRRFRAVVELLVRLEAAVLVVEDAHWADQATLDFLLFLTSREPPPVSVVVTYRPGEVPAGSPLLRLSSRPPAGITPPRLTLGALDRPLVARLASSMLGGGPVSGELAEFLSRTTRGVPLVVEESVRLMYERADLARRDGEWVGRRPVAVGVPPAVRDAVLERTGRLSGAALQAVRAAAVLAEPAPEEILAAVAGLRADRVGAALARALGSGLLRPGPPGLVSSRDEVSARAVYESTPEHLRQAMHRRAGRVLERRSPPPLTQLARHCQGAGEVAKWCDYAERAADLALASGDPDTAANLLYDLLTGADLPARAVGRLARKVPFPSVAGSDRLRDLETALRATLERPGLGRREAAEVRHELARVLLTMEDFAAGLAEMEAAVRHLPAGSVDTARAMVTLGWAHALTGTAAEPLRWLRRAGLAAAALTGADRLDVTVGRASALAQLGEAEGWELADQLPEDAPTAQERHQIARGQLNLGDAAMRWGRYADARRRLTRALELAERQQYPRYSAIVRVTQAHLDWFTGAWDGLAGRVAALAAEEGMQPLTRHEAVLVAGVLGTAHGAFAEAEERLRHALAEARRYGAVLHRAEAAAALGRLLLAGHRVEEALAVTAEPVEVIAHRDVWLWATDILPVRVEALVAAGRGDEAVDLVRGAGRGLRAGAAPAPRAALVLCRAMLAESRREKSRAAALYARAASAWEALPRPYAALLARERQAACLLTTGAAEDGHALLGEVESGLAGLGARSDAQRVARLRAGGPDAWRRGRRGYGDRLSPRERDVAGLVATGLTNREIGEILHRSPKTVANQLNSAMRKVGVTTRTGLAIRVVATGLAPTRPPGPPSHSGTLGDLSHYNAASQAETVMARGRGGPAAGED